jgi:hypothetical protein
MTAGRRERRRANGGVVDIDAVKAGRETLNVDVDVKDPGGILGELGPADDVAGDVAQFGTGTGGAIPLADGDSGDGQDENEAPEEEPDARSMSHGGTLSICHRRI